MNVPTKTIPTGDELLDLIERTRFYADRDEYEFIDFDQILFALEVFCRQRWRADRQLRDLRNEINCRIEHGAESGGHLEYVQGQLDAISGP
jgi:hypothetical protein